MTKEPFFEIYQEHLREVREGLNKYTRKAFQMLPELDKPHILDIGCGSGVPTIDLARLSNGEITGLDIDQSALAELERKIAETGLSNRVNTMKCSMFEMDFPDESFDIIWAEGSIHRIGFEKGLREWRRFLKPDGFLVVHDDIENTTNKVNQIPDCGYKLIGLFPLPEEAWWVEYYGPLEKRVRELRTKYRDAPEALKLLDEKQDEIDQFKKDPKSFCSVFLVMQKK